MIIFRLLANGLAPLTLLGAVSAYFFPELFLPIKNGFMWMFAATMFAMGIVLEPRDLNETLQRPRPLAWAY